MLSCTQRVLDAYCLKARGAEESEKEHEACSALAAEANSLLLQLQGVPSSDALHAAPGQAAAVYKASAAKASTQKQKTKNGKQLQGVPSSDAVHAAPGQAAGLKKPSGKPRSSQKQKAKNGKQKSKGK